MRLIKSLANVLVWELLLVIVMEGLLLKKGCGILTISGLFFLQLAISVYLIVRVILRLRDLESALETYEKSEPDEEPVNIQNDTPYLPQFKKIMDRYTDKRIRENSEQIMDKQTQLTALQSQINPHFLYNTLDSIRGQALLDNNVEIARMVEALASFFRYSISRKGNLVTLRDELNNIDNYMMIQRYRFNNRFSLEIIIDEEDETAYDILIPKLIIQPVVENAIFHGLEEKMEGGVITIEVILTEQNLILTISDNGSGMSQQQLDTLNEKIHFGNLSREEKTNGSYRNTGIALPNIHKRLQLLFGEEYGLNIYSTEGMGTDVELTIPVSSEGRGKRECAEKY